MTRFAWQKRTSAPKEYIAPAVTSSALASPYAADDSVLREGGRLMNLTPAGKPDIDTLARELASGGVSLLLGTALDFAGVTRVKGVPVRRLRGFCQEGMGASPTWNV